MSKPELTIHAAGVNGLQMHFNMLPEPALALWLQALRQRVLRDLQDVVHEVVPAYHTLLVYYEPRAIRPYDLELWLRQLVTAEPWPDKSAVAREPTKIPVVYGGEAGPDLATVAQQTGLTQAAVIAHHTDRVYTVYALGFAPGFAYCGTLDEALALPRRAEPRTRVPAGSVGIAAQQTAVYPIESPGGWHLIGRSPVTWLQLGDEPEPLVKVGDSIQFVAITAQEWQQWESRS